MRVKIGDIHLFFDVEGTKLVPDGPTMKERPTLLLLHGGPGFDHSSFKPSFSQLADVAQIIYIDQRGQGRSDRSDPHYWTIDQWADDVRAFCDALEIERPVVLGVSFGARVAMAYAASHPDHPGKLILTSAKARQRLDRVFDVFERLGGLEARAAAKRFWENQNEETFAEYSRICVPLYTQTPQDPDIALRAIQNLEISFKAYPASHDVLPRLKEIRCPTLVIVGEEDPVTPVDDSEDIVAALPPNLVRFERFPGCGHGVYRDDPDSYFRVVREFISND